MKFAGLFQEPRDRDKVGGEPYTWQCKRCGWITLFVAAPANEQSWRTVETKRLDKPALAG